MTTEPADTRDELIRLRALLSATRLERDELADRLATLNTEPPVPVRGQAELPGLT